MKTLTFPPYTYKETRKKVSKNVIFEARLSTGTRAHHGFRREVGLELGTDDAAVAVWARDLAPDAPVPRPLGLRLRLVDVRHPLTAVPCHLLLGVHALDLHQRGVLVLVGLRPDP